MHNVQKNNQHSSQALVQKHILLPNGAGIYDMYYFATTFDQLYAQYIATYDVGSQDAYVLYIPSTINDYCITLPTSISEQLIKKNIYIIVQSNASATIDHQLLGKQHTMIRCFLEPYAQLTFVQKNKHAQQAEQSISIDQQEKSICHFYGWYEKPTNVQITSHLRGVHALSDIRIGCLGSDDEKIVIKTSQQHHASHTQSSSMIKGIMHDASHGSHEGTIYIALDVEQIIADQQSAYILMDATAQAYTQPNLQVLSHNVQCAHGSAIGAFDDEQLFYMLSRGLERQDALALLQQAFFDDIRPGRTG